MEKNYSVDDILLEIKSKKSRQKGASPQPLQEEAFPVSRKNVSGVAFAPEPRQDNTFTEESFEPQSGSAAQTGRVPTQRPSRQTGAFDVVRPADASKKRRGGSSRAGQPPVVRPSRQTASFDAVRPVEDPPGKPAKKGASSHTGPISAPPLQTAPFNVVRPAEDVPEAAKQSAPPHTATLPAQRPSRQNPLNYEGHVRPITERAKIRKSSYEGIARHREQEETAVIDFAKFKEASLEEETVSSEETRVIPRLGDPSVMQDFELDEDDGEDFDRTVDKPAVDFSEYNSVEDRRDVAIDIARTKLWLVIRTTLTLLLTAILIFLVLNGRYVFALSLPSIVDPIDNVENFLKTLTGGAILLALVNSSAIGGGLLSLFRMRANSDSLAAFAMLASIGQCVYSVLQPGEANVASLTFYCAVAALAILFNVLGKLSMISRIQANFRIISSDKAKRVVTIANDDSFTREYLHGANHRPAIAVAAPCEFFTDFLALSYSDKYDVGINRVVAPICLACSLVAGGLTYMLNQGGTMAALSTLTGILCVSATLSATFVENVPLSKLTKKLAPRGGMVSGNKAVEDFCDISAVALDENDLFPKGSVQITGIKAFAQGRVDEAILDAASIVNHMESAMSSAFLGMLGGNRRMLRQVSTASFEAERGITAWMDGRRVTLGGQKMMRTAGITIPEMEANMPMEHGEVLYLASDGEISARFIVNYQIDEALALELDRLSSMEKLLIIHAVDPSLTPHKIWEIYGYPEELVRIMPAERHDSWKNMTAPRKSELAEIAYTGKASAMVGALLACVQARSSILAATVLQLIQVTLGYGAISLLGFLGAIDQATILVLSAYQLFWFVIIWLTQKLKSA